MKNIIITFLRNGCTSTKKYTAEQLIKAFYPLKNIMEADGNGAPRLKNNIFWDHTNNARRVDLINELRRARLHDIKTSYFTIINRYENGDAYGINKNI